MEFASRQHTKGVAGGNWPMPKGVSSVAVDSRGGSGKTPAVSRQTVHRISQKGELAVQHIWLFVTNWGRYYDSHGYRNIRPF
jgi:hypothetical protein